MDKKEKICIDCGKTSYISPYHDNSAFCRSCSLKKENKVYRWDKVEKFMAQSYKRGCIDTRKRIKYLILNILYKEYPQFRYMLKRENHKTNGS